MKRAAIVLAVFVFSVSAFAKQQDKGKSPVSQEQQNKDKSQDLKPCVILQRMGPADQITSHLFAFGLRGKQYEYVEGDLPKKVKFHGRLTDNDMRNILKHGGVVKIIPPKYSEKDLQDARDACKQQ